MTRSQQNWKHFLLVFAGMGGIVAAAVYFAAIKERTEELPKPVYERPAKAGQYDVNRDGQVDEQDIVLYMRGASGDGASATPMPAATPPPTPAPRALDRPSIDTPGLIEQIRTREGRDIRSAVAQFGAAAPQGAEGIPVLIEVVADPDVEVDTRVLAAWALGRYEGAASEALPALEALLVSPELQQAPVEGEVAQHYIQTRHTTVQTAIQIIRGAVK